MILKPGTVLAINSQDNLNDLAELVDIPQDSLIIDEPFIAFMDDVLHVMPERELDDGHLYYGIKPRKFSVWYRNAIKAIEK